jgi:hypothetical protein
MRRITKLRIDSVDHVAKGAGHECVALLRKAASNAPEGSGPLHEQYWLQFERVRRGNPRLSREAQHAMTWNSMSESEQLALIAEECGHRAAAERAGTIRENDEEEYERH